MTIRIKFNLVKMLIFVLSYMITRAIFSTAEHSFIIRSLVWAALYTSSAAIFDYYKANHNNNNNKNNDEL